VSRALLAVGFGLSALCAVCTATSTAGARTLDEAFPPPAGFARVGVAEGSFAAYLRRLPLRPPGTPVRSHRGDVIRAADDPRVAAVVDLDVGARDLQQCADSIIRLHAEWLWASRRGDEIAYPLVSGGVAAWSRWARGERPRFDAHDRPVWRPAARPDASRQAFRAYLDVVFAYASTRSLDDRARRPARSDVRPGDFFVLGGSPGHAVLILDIAVAGDGRRAALIGQGYMPAQDFHVVADGGDGGGGGGSAWISLDGDAVATPFWKPFPWSSLRRLEP
jgi:uncharacterized protein DUF4846